MKKFSKKVAVPYPKVRVIKHQHELSVRSLIIFLLAFGVIGYLIYRSFAASPVVATVQGETMSLPAGASIISDNNASGSQVVKMTQNGSLGGNFSLPSQATSMLVTARGDQCSGSPTLTGSIDGKILINAVSVGSTSYANYSATINLGAGTHSLSISGSNLGAVVKGHGKKQSTCYRNLYIDVTIFYGPTASPPTASLAANPTSITSAQSSTLIWGSTNATACTASGAWSGSKATSGSQSVSPTVTSTYSLTCTGSGGSATASTTVTVTTASASSIYWGAYMDGNDTYASYYGNPAPNGQDWMDAPWGNTGNTWDRFEQNAGKKVSVCHYGQPNPWLQATFYGSTANICTNRGAIVAMDMSTGSTSLTDIANGVYDSQIKAWADNVKAWGKPFFLRLDTEMNGTWESYGPNVNGNTPQEFINMWRHFHDVVVGQGATNVTWFWVPNVGTVQNGSVYPLQNYYPGDAYVDWTGFDGYNQSSTSQSSATIFGASYNEELQIAPSKPMGIGETSSHEYGGQKAAWITDLLGTQLPRNFPHIKMILWFNWRIYQNGSYQDWPIESSSTSQAAFKAGIGSPYYATNNYGNLPPLTKVQPLP